ncbi:hypothetical protein L484_019824 [Morus notabilis]|uniref:Uncharacterized protein n=1 Tax=Morus notabilis TaxID=981085 RepID=W9S1U1_9ROSA|nr:hypothetical protein L484_019824 [Morus notabilis]
MNSGRDGKILFLLMKLNRHKVCNAGHWFGVYLLLAGSDWGCKRKEKGGGWMPKNIRLAAPGGFAGMGLLVKGCRLDPTAL